MYFKQFYLGCLAHASYLIGSDGEAAVVDPRRDVGEYLEEAARQGFRIKYVVETHLHADFVSGHCELAARAGAEVVIGQRAGAKFPHRAVRDGDELRVGKVTLRFLETPGHTPESVCVLVTDAEAPGEPPKLLTGDTLFVGDVGRPDLSGARGHTTEQMAAMLYDSLHGKLLQLPDETEVYPAHGAGSMCGRNISKETSSTVGLQRRSNYALAPMAKEEFVRLMTAELPEAPSYFARDAEINRAGASALEEVARPAALSPEEFARLAKEKGHTVLDVRAAAEYGAGHVPGAINIGLGGQFAAWAGSLLAPQSPVLLVAEDEGRVGEAVTRLARVGLENVRGYLAGGMEGWRAENREVATLPQMTVDELRAKLEARDGWQVIDVRRAGEYASGHVPGATLAPLSRIESNDLDGVERTRPTAVICAGGYRSSAAASFLARKGFTRLHNVAGGTSAYVAAGHPVEK